MAELSGFIVGDAEAQQLLKRSRINPDDPQYARLYRIAAASYSLRALGAPSWMVHSLLEQVLTELADEFDHQRRKNKGLTDRADRANALRRTYFAEFKRLSARLGKNGAAKKIHERIRREVGPSVSVPGPDTIRRWADAGRRK